MQLPHHGTRAQVVGDETARHVVVELHIRGNFGERFGIFVVVLVEEVGNGKHNLQKESDAQTLHAVQEIIAHSIQKMISHLRRHRHRCLQSQEC